MAGKYQVASGQDGCDDCEAGTYGDKRGASSCTDCAAGKVSNGTGFTACDECTKGKYQPAPGQDVCALCKGELTTRQTGHSLGLSLLGGGEIQGFWKLFPEPQVGSGGLWGVPRSLWWGP